MTGIRRFEAVWLACAFASTGMADEVTLEGDSHLGGTVTAIAENGGITLETPLSSEPVAVRGEAIRNITFSHRGDFDVQGNALLTLANGDVLPGEVRSLEGETLALGTSFAGDLSIPRTLLARLNFGIVPNRRIYEGPVTLTDWEAERWTCKNGVFFSQGPGRIARSFDLPQQFILRFHLVWKNNPNLQVGFAESGGEGKTDRYFFQFTNAGIEIKRQIQADSKQLSLTTVNRQPEQFSDSDMDVEIRVDRREAKLQLLIDGRLEARIDDPAGQPPAGGMISFRSNMGGESTHQISKIQLLSWDAVGERHRTEERGDPKTDALIDAEGGRYSGSLEAIRSGPQGALLHFKSPLLDKPMDIPAAEVSTVFFATNKPAETTMPPMVLKLHGGGELHVERCTFAGDKIAIRHPLLGELALSRAALMSVERPPTGQKPTNRP